MKNSDRHLVLVGGGHAHLATLAALPLFVSRGHRVTVVQPSFYHYYSGMGPGMLGGIYEPNEIRFDTRQTVTAGGGLFRCDRAVRVEASKRRVHLESGAVIDYDVLSINAGSRVPPGLVAETGPDIFFVKPIESLVRARQRLKALAARHALRVAVVGGGAAGVEIAGALWRLLNRDGNRGHRVALYAGRRLLGRFPRQVRRRVLNSFRKQGITVHQGEKVAGVKPGRVILQGGNVAGADVIFVAVGVSPPELFGRSGLAVGKDGGLAVNAYLQCPDHPEIFGGGDCIFFAPRPLDKVGVYAVRQNPVLRHNLLAALEKSPLKPFDPGGSYLLILNLGDATGILVRNGLVAGGRLAFKAKDAIDRRFMRRFARP